MVKRVINALTNENMEYTASQIIKAGDFVFVSGQRGDIDNQNKPIEGIEAQTKQCLENIKEMLQAAGTSLSDAVKIDVLLRNSSDRPKMHDVFYSYYSGGKSIRTTHIVRSIHPNALIEMDCIAYCPPRKESSWNHTPAVIAGEFVFATGQRGDVNNQGKTNIGIEAQTRQCLENVKELLQAAGASLSDVIKVTLLLENSADFDKMDKVYQSYFPKDQPCRTTHLVSGFNPEGLIEIDCIAYCPK